MAIAPYPTVLLEVGRQVGVIYVDATITNELDAPLAELRQLPEDQVRSPRISKMLVDTGALTLALPAEIIAAPGLRHSRDIEVDTANGRVTRGLNKDAKLSVMGRSGTFECISLPEGSIPLLGCIPMEMLGLDPDLQTQSLNLLPAGPDATCVILY